MSGESAGTGSSIDPYAIARSYEEPLVPSLCFMLERGEVGTFLRTVKEIYAKAVVSEFSSEVKTSTGAVTYIYYTVGYKQRALEAFGEKRYVPTSRGAHRAFSGAYLSYFLPPLYCPDEEDQSFDLLTPFSYLSFGVVSKYLRSKGSHCLARMSDRWPECNFNSARKIYYIDDGKEKYTDDLLLEGGNVFLGINESLRALSLRSDRFTFESGNAAEVYDAALDQWYRFGSATARVPTRALEFCLDNKKYGVPSWLHVIDLAKALKEGVKFPKKIGPSVFIAPPSLEIPFEHVTIERFELETYDVLPMIIHGTVSYTKG